MDIIKQNTFSNFQVYLNGTVDTFPALTLVLSCLLSEIFETAKLSTKLYLIMSIFITFISSDDSELF